MMNYFFVVSCHCTVGWVDFFILDVLTGVLYQDIMSFFVLLTFRELFFQLLNCVRRRQEVLKFRGGNKNLNFLQGVLNFSFYLFINLGNSENCLKNLFSLLSLCDFLKIQTLKGFLADCDHVKIRKNAENRPTILCTVGNLKTNFLV